LKSSDFLTYGIKSVSQIVLPAFESAFDLNFTPREFDSFQDVRDLFEGGIKLPLDVISTISPLPVIKELFRTDGENVLKFPPPHVVKGVINTYLFKLNIMQIKLCFEYFHLLIIFFIVLISE
jgi:linoleate 9S-lipoxygenase